MDGRPLKILKTQVEAKEIKSVDVLRSIAAEENPFEAVFSLESGEVLTQERSQAGSILFKIWDLNRKSVPQSVFTYELKSPTPQKIWFCYLPEGPVLAPTQARLILSPDAEFVYRAAQANDFYLEHKSLNSDNLQLTGCSLGPDEYAFIKDNPHSGCDLYLGKRRGAGFDISKFTLWPSMYFESMCSPEEGVLCFQALRRLYIWKRAPKGTFILSDLITLDQVINSSSSYNLTGLRAISRNELVAQVYCNFSESGKPLDEQLLVKINITDHSLVQLKTVGNLLWEEETLRLSAHLPLFIISKTNRSLARSYYIFNAVEMSLQHLPLPDGYSLKAITLDSKLLITNKSKVQVIAVREIMELFQSIEQQIQAQLSECIQTGDLVRLVTSYIGGDVRLSSNFATLYGQKKPGVSFNESLELPTKYPGCCTLS